MPPPPPPPSQRCVCSYGSSLCIGFVIEGGVVKLYSTLMAENLCTILCCLHTFHKKKKKRWSRQTTIDHLKFIKGAKKYLVLQYLIFLNLDQKQIEKKLFQADPTKNNSKLENLKIVKYLCCTICFQIDTQFIRYCLLHTMLQSTST